MKKNIAIMTYSQKAADVYSEILEHVFQGEVLIQKYCVEKDLIKERIKADLAIISSYDIYNLSKKYISKDKQMMIPNLTFLKSSIQQILDLPIGTRAFLVNANFDMSIQTIEQIYQFGARHIELIPYSPYLENIKKINTAITPGEGLNCPKWVNQVIDIGYRVIDISTIVNILIYFDLEKLFNTEVMKSYYKKIMPQNFLPNSMMKMNPLSMNDFFVTNYKYGIIGFSPKGVILNYNSVAQKILGNERSSVIGENILTLFPEPLIQETLMNLKPQRKKQIQINGKDLLVDIKVGFINNTKICYLVFELMHEQALTIPSSKNQIIGQGYQAKYQFKDIITHNDKMDNLKGLATLNAGSESSILILGESGTGKELFAQAIHNASKRWARPFVAINCAAIAESLLESELFGYDKGAFTGALRGGKKGLFELAHSGTIFLDEIGEMPVHLQARLLRVLQEKEVTPVGGNRVISVDVRVLAATNCNISQLIQNGNFRKDLYYRLNVVTLNIPPLRDRKEDIPLLIQTFKKEMGVEFDISPEVINALQQHRWEGNVRELRNCIEYFANIGKRYINTENIPFLHAQETKPVENKNKASGFILKWKKRLGENFADAVHVLEILKDARDIGRTVGRRSIAKISKEKYSYLSEMRIRLILAQLSEYNFIIVLKGRGGSKITESGIRFLAAILGET